MKRWYDYRPLVQLAGMSDAQRQQAAREAAKALESGCMHDPKYRHPAVAHLAGVWADESEDGMGDEQKVRVLGLQVQGGPWRARFVLVCVLWECLHVPGLPSRTVTAHLCVCCLHGYMNIAVALACRGEG